MTLRFALWHIFPNQLQNDCYFRSIFRTSSGNSVESLSTPLKLLQKDDSISEYIVCMSPQDFDHIYNQGHPAQSNR